MSEENDKASALGTRRFRLPKLFADSEEGTEVDSGFATGVADNVANSGGHEIDATNLPATSSAAPINAHAATTGDEDEDVSEVLVYVAGMAQELLALRDKLGFIADQVEEMNARESTQEKVFNTLHAELSDYKKDFIYEHLKPVVRPLLFLYDSLEQFDDEVARLERPNDERRQSLSPIAVRQNVAYFRDQLVEALRVCEVTMMDTPEGQFNAKLQKAVGVETVPAAQANSIVRVVRSGWYLNGQLLRPAEVIVGRSAA